MKVFVVLAEEWGWYQVDSVCASEEAADARVAELVNSVGGDYAVEGYDVIGGTA
jgi:hypothetical protein